MYLTLPLSSSTSTPQKWPGSLGGGQALQSLPDTAVVILNQHAGLPAPCHLPNLLVLLELCLHRFPAGSRTFFGRCWTEVGGGGSGGSWRGGGEGASSLNPSPAICCSMVCHIRFSQELDPVPVDGWVWRGGGIYNSTMPCSLQARFDSLPR